MPFGFPDTFQVNPFVKNTGSDDVWKQNVALKLEFGVELAKNPNNPFEAACKVFGADTNKALWVSINWLNDPEVIRSKANYSENTQQNVKLLDKDELALKLLTFADEKINFNGNLVYAAEARDRLKALEMYAKIQGYDKSGEVNNNFVHNEMVVKFVEPKKEETKVIEHKVEEAVTPTPIKLKLVG